jgi:hypothetical protein
MKFCKELKKLCEHFSIVNRTTSYDYLEIIGLITRLVQQLMKKGLCKYGLQKGHVHVIQTYMPLLVVVYPFNK